jgi:predicted dehydrogenase
MKQVALIGCAHIHTPGFVKKLAAHQGIRVVSVWDHDAGRARKNAEALPGSRVAESPEQALRDYGADGAVICSETDRHEDLVIGAAEAGKHIFAEKPLGIDGASAYRMARSIEAAGVLFQTGYFMRGDPVHRFLKSAIADGFFGKITRVRHANCHAGSLKGWFDEEWRWMADPKQAGCGAFGDLGTHSLDILLWLLGPAVSVAAHVGVATGRYGDCDEYGEGILVFGNGATATLAAGWVDVANPVTVVVSGTEGHAHVVQGQLYLTSAKLDGADGKTPWTKLPAPLPSAFDLFLDSLCGGANELVGVREAAERSAVMESLYRAARNKTWETPLRK